MSTSFPMLTILHLIVLTNSDSKAVSRISLQVTVAHLGFYFKGGGRDSKYFEKIAYLLGVFGPPGACSPEKFF